MKKITLLFIIFQLSIFTLQAQNSTEDKEKLKQINQELLANYKAGKIDNALGFAQKAVDLSIKIYGAESLETASAYTNLAILLRAKKKYRESIQNLQKSLEIYRLKPAQHAKFIARILDELALAFALDGDKTKAEEIYREALQTAETAYGKDSKEILPYLKSMTEVFILVKKYDEAQEMYIRQYLTARKYFEPQSANIQEILDSYYCFNLQSFKMAESIEKQKQFFEAIRPTENKTADTSENKTINGGVINGKAKNLVQPMYPSSARTRNAQGIIPVRVTIDENGNVISAKALCGDSDLRAVSEEAARRSKFSPTLLSGQPVKVTGTIVYSFVF